ncbi:hypothetical protein ACTVNG_01130 [Serratia ureilytica]|uniref:hypothetical protein n=1 Tax=Serratia ureilytica TaxID=300181 RepID=UPI003FA6C69C
MSTTDLIAFWAMLGTWFSGAMTLIALFFAYKALTTWKEQEKTKVKMEFKKSLIALKNQLTWMPSQLNLAVVIAGRKAVQEGNDSAEYGDRKKQVHISKSYAEKFEKFDQCMLNCMMCWVATEHLFDNSEVAQLWINICQIYLNYLQGDKQKRELTDALDELSSMRFVFDHK